MRVVSDFPRKVMEQETWIPLADGTRLAARIWRPVDADDDPVPAILEYLPYRKRDLTAERDAQVHPYWAGHGYAGVRVDIRGTGESDGVLTDEYLQQELDDGVAVLEWLERQPWCTGSVGMVGISWGGFNGLQIAAMRPPQLKAVITICFTDDRYADDIHHMGGCLLADNLSWASTMFDGNAIPPDPALVGGDWFRMWLDRLDGSGLWLSRWLQHQRRDDYWKHGSVCEDYSRIQVPVYAISGWADGYCNAVFRLLAGLTSPRKGLVGPWAHKYPHLGVPGPAIGFLQEGLRWWDHWLKDQDTGIMDEPMLRVWMQQSMPPSARYSARPGRWVAEPSWPSPHIMSRSWRLTSGHDLRGEDGTDAKDGDDDESLDIRSPLSVGLYAGKWCSYNAPPDLPHDQRDEDGGALIFQTPRLEQDLEICGAPSVQLELSADQPVAMVALRLVDIAEDDKATRVSYGVLNLTHRDSDEHPEPLVPGRRYRVTVCLKHIAQQFPAGHAIRLAISTSYWPLVWPAPRPVRLTLWPGACRLVLPTRVPRPAEEAALRPFEEPEGAPPLAKTLLQPSQESWKVIRDLANDQTTLEVFHDEGSYRLDDIALDISGSVTERYSYSYGNYDSVTGWTEWQRTFRRGDWEIHTLTRTRLTSDADSFRVRATLDAWQGDTRIFSRSWDEVFPRDLV
ncbi:MULTISPECIES: CocE/NonD family hydrolase [Halomonas]|uniref:CocE/NonD family hydrolase n=2 Tax=Halomonas TaxID=2745 RepID=A0AAU7KGN1_9GAMM|nr:MULTISPECIES: CocE/NonD family hydrolase [Halomonas]MBR9773366.1 CocE/NonD family hydrolase [Gammaproteobacteria bacterium]KJZ02675.1 peptidase S15 [Halomonas sp. S2151]MAR74638.1 peptidase S15 [Halomonas sp.]MBR9882095.1 CocE/NonD family hydrolase [Gammaproteobacteria bacterium]MBS8271205.1 CocE/NonD family hydrolase [Halomonas litopenaei]|tara:strand:- start:42 stop:2081 length:2040 start_codon:yes stop_codon:yes gene_type:complete